jgi:hypothetical protein
VHARRELPRGEASKEAFSSHRAVYLQCCASILQRIQGSSIRLATNHCRQASKSNVSFLHVVQPLSDWRASGKQHTTEENTMQ